MRAPLQLLRDELAGVFTGGASEIRVFNADGNTAGSVTSRPAYCTILTPFFAASIRADRTLGGSKRPMMIAAAPLAVKLSIALICLSTLISESKVRTGSPSFLA